MYLKQGSAMKGGEPDPDRRGAQEIYTRHSESEQCTQYEVVRSWHLTDQRRIKLLKWKWKKA